MVGRVPGTMVGRVPGTMVGRYPCTMVGIPTPVPPLYHPGYTTLPLHTRLYPALLTAELMRRGRKPWAQEGNIPWVREKEDHSAHQRCDS